VQLGEATDEKPKPKRASLPKGVTPDKVTVEMAVGLLALPRLLGKHPETDAPIKASLGRFGPYVVHDQGKVGKDYRSLKAEDDVLTVTLERALALLAEPKGRRGRRKAEPLKELGAHPDDGEQVAIFNGPYGHYVKHGKVNASLPEGKTPDDITLELALELLAAKAGTKKKTTRKKSTTKRAAASKKTTAKKTTAKKTTAKKTTAKKTTAKKTTAKKTTSRAKKTEE